MKSQEELEVLMAQIKARPEMLEPLATIEENAFLALIRLALEARLRLLNWILETPQEQTP